jgi:hypothetical protein
MLFANRGAPLVTDTTPPAAFSVFHRFVAVSPPFFEGFRPFFAVFTVF